ncbi:MULTISPECIES: hypothetical protein [unclassified Nocardioides]|uniref:hypothetical protein n=1 Tax=unclassified Nocardioides TaxID=2615069 RepID=UPI00030F8532|nr:MULTISPECIES: hypothetical protein [unclassified Nocardioides]
MSAEPHLERAEYVGALAALADAERVIEDLVELGEGRTVVAVDEYSFLARRALVLVRACSEFERSR